MEIKYYIENPELIINSDHLELHELNDFDINVIKNLKNVKAKRGEKKHGRIYVDAIGTHDLEATRIKLEELTKPYIFQTLVLVDGIGYFFGIREDRTLQKFFDKVANALGHEKGTPRTLIIFDFNWNYEYGFERSLFKFTDMFFKDVEHPLYGYSHGGHFEWRDAQALFGPGGLATATKGLEHEKLKGDLDYSKKLYPWSKIDAKPEYDENGRRHSEFDYMVNDVAGLAEAVVREMKVNGCGCSLYGLKRTFTGWVRKDISKILYPKRLYKDSITEHDTYHVHKLLNEARRGGNTHGNKEYTSLALDFVCKDVSSMYPAVMLEKYPYGPFQKVHWPSKDIVEDELERRENAMLIRIRVTNLELKDEFEAVPYVSKDKCRHLVGLGQLQKFTYKGTVRYKQAPVVGEEDNGRVSYCCYMECTVTDVDLRIMKKMYNFDYDVDELYLSKYEYLPDEIRDYIINLYKIKVEYTGRPELAEERAKAKVRINSIFGLFCAALLKDPVVYDPKKDDYITEIMLDKPDYFIENEYKEQCKKTLTVPRIGIWVCALARERLQSFLDVVGCVDTLYVDTDSCFYTNPEKHEDAINALNEVYKQKAIEYGAYATDDTGETHYCGVFEDDKDGKVVYLGAKKYAYEKDGKIKITVAGVPKKAGSEELAEAGGLDAFKPGMVFHAGKLRPIYNKKDSYGTRHVVDEYGVEGDIEVKSNICLVDVDYNLGYGTTYGNLIDAVKKGDMSILHEMLENTDRDVLTAEVLKRRYHLEN